MKIFVIALNVIICLLGGLFLYQNWSRTIEMDSNGYAISLDLGIVGFAHTTPLSISQMVLITLTIGIVIGLLLPAMLKVFKTPSYS